MSRGGARRSARWTLLTRAAFLLVAGNLLIVVWSIDILHFYAFYLGLGALLLLALPRWALPLAATGFALSGVLLRVAFPDVSRPSADEYWTALGMFQNVVGWGIHPLLPWLGFIATGLWIGRHDLADRPTRARLAWIGLVLATGAPLLSVALERIVTAAGPVEYLRFLGTGWSPSPLYLVAASGTSMFAIALAQEIAERFEPRWPVRALVATGQLSLTIYVLHALVGVGVPRWVLGLESGLSLGWVALWALLFCASVVPLAWLWRRSIARGPLEWVMRLVTLKTPSLDPAETGARLRAPALWLWSPIPVGVVLVVGLHVVGASLDIDCVEARPLDDATHGELTLLCPRRSYEFDLAEAAEVTLETHAPHDLYLELYDSGDALVAENDDGGAGLNARIVQTLEPGHYRVLLRPFRAATGGYALSRTDGPPRPDVPGCSNTCSSSHDDECDDGGEDSLYDVCELGTDCADCGPR